MSRTPALTVSYLNTNRLLLGLLFSCLVTGCSTNLLGKNTASDLVPDGSQAVLKQQLTILAGKGRVYIQHGEVIQEHQRDQYKPYCWLQSWKVLDVQQQIMPDTFTIKSSRRYEELVYSTRPLLLAFNTRNDKTIQLASSGITAIEQQTVLDIHSENQPDIRELKCSYWDDPTNDKHLTLQEIRTALGNIVHIKLAGQ